MKTLLTNLRNYVYRLKGAHFKAGPDKEGGSGPNTSRAENLNYYQLRGLTVSNPPLEARIICGLPDNQTTRELYKSVLSVCGGALGWVPTSRITAELCSIAVTQDPHALEYVPSALRTERLCTMAVQKNRYALIHVPSPLLSAEMFNRANPESTK